ncbi:tautomerase family protein [Sulfurirhabdus autotrophica]|uniref:Tautomerase-like protein n=1 Tax=Sulfurirhabdus autotrophica TaxID=1706046 RepID=A0A4R3Y161_9PROT|nr:tautomerase family protein [Sulfurirhabdus autotrophica]TCV85845.1 tautomerase-like protein [Sulfurirhabdus autotrophica]
MPSVLIEVRRQYTQEQEIALVEAIHMALREAFQILPGDKNVRLIVHQPHRFACPPAREKPDFYTHISIDAFAGRSLDAKRNLYKAVVSNLEPFGIPKDHVKILRREIAKENWGIRGGQAECDVERGFKVEV